MGDLSDQMDGAICQVHSDSVDNLEEQSSSSPIKSRDVSSMELNGDKETESVPLDFCYDKSMINGKISPIESPITTMDTTEQTESVTVETLINIDLNAEVPNLTSSPTSKPAVTDFLVELNEDNENCVVPVLDSLEPDSGICLENSKSDVTQNMSEGIRPNDNLLNHNSASNQIDNKELLVVINTDPPLNENLISVDKTSMPSEDKQILKDSSAAIKETQENSSNLIQKSEVVDTRQDSKLSPNVNKNSTNNVPSSKSVQNSPTNSTKLIHSRELSLEELTDSLLNETEEVCASNSDKISVSSSPVLSNKSSPSPERTEHIYGLNQDSARSSPSNLGLNGLSGSILSHPAYKMAMQDLLSFREQVGALKHECDRYSIFFVYSIFNF